MKELTHEQLGWLIQCYDGRWVSPGDCYSSFFAESGLVYVYNRNGQFTRYHLTPAGRELVDIALRAVNAHRRSKS